jgi:tetratricopeptide (TPR) repeat protein
MKQRQKRKPVPPQADLDTQRLTGWKLWRLRLLALAVPFVLLAMVELALRLAGFGYPTAFLISSANHGQKTFVQNNKFGWRFFGKRMARAPYPISILQDKPAGTIRIFVFGESAAYGDPQPTFGLPRVLQATLSLRHPGVKFEVVNAAMTAINSHVIRAIAGDCARAGGDIWVVYMGNNEVVGPFGAGTVFGTQALPVPLVRANLALKATRLGELVEIMWNKVQRPPLDKSEWGGMQMFINQQVRADDPRMTRVYQSFQHNLADIIRMGHDSGAGVVVSTVAVNLKDCAPFGSENRVGMSEADKGKWDEAMRAGIAAQTAGAFEAAAQLDDSSAELQFRLGRCLLASGDIGGARKAFGAARDEDTLRFRCDSRLNDLVRKEAAGREGERILLADAESSFAAASPGGLPGWDLFYEHVHLTFAGNCLLARTLGEQIDKLLPQNVLDKTAAWPDAEACARRLGWTPYELKSALDEVLGRLIDPPFTAQINHDAQVEYVTKEAQLAEKEASVDGALRATEAAVVAGPDDAELYEQLASLDHAAGHDADAEGAARRAVDLLPSSEEAWSQLGQTFVAQKKYEEAANAYQRAFDLDPQDVFPLQNVAMAMSKLGRNTEAMRVYRRALAITPRFGLAWLGLGQILESMGRKDEAADCYQKALENRIHRPSELTTLARFCMSRGWLQAASTNFNDAVRMDPTDPSLLMEAGRAHFLFGMELGKSGQTASAAGEFQEAVRFMPEVVEARLNLGIALYKEGQWNESFDEFQQITARSPTNALALHYLDLLRSRVK